jgi:aerobic carbon-monoxide dehydrogenase medium subunit
VYPSSFEYFAPTTLDEALSLLDRYGDDAKVLAGGQSLIPMMKLRFAAPSVLVDINRIPGLDGIEETDGSLALGPLVRTKMCERSALLRRDYPTLGDTAPLVSDPIVRNLGTVAGSLVHADPQGDWGAALLAADAEVEARSLAGARTIPVTDFLLGGFETALRPTEIVTRVRVPKPTAPRYGGTYSKLERKVGDFATVGVAVQVALDGAGRVERAGIALTAVGPINFRATAAEEALVGRELDDEAIREAGARAAEAAEPQDDVRGTIEYKRQVVRVFTERGLRKAAAERTGAAEAAPWGVRGVPETFSGEEAIAGVMEELREKEGGPQ